MPRPPAYETPNAPPIPIGPGVAQVLSGDVVVLLSGAPVDGDRVVLFPLNLVRERRSRD